LILISSVQVDHQKRKAAGNKTGTEEQPDADESKTKTRRRKKNEFRRLASATATRKELPNIRFRQLRIVRSIIALAEAPLSSGRLHVRDGGRRRADAGDHGRGAAEPRRRKVVLVAIVLLALPTGGVRVELVERRR
jgi:hypothetical protein